VYARGALLGQTCQTEYSNDVHSSLNTPETRGVVDVDVDAEAVLLNSRTGGLQKCDMREGWSGSMCYVWADRNLRSPPLRHDPRGGPRGSRPKAGDPSTLQTARTGDCRRQVRPACARWGRDLERGYRLWMTPR
jgi:hypothetical protein